MKYKGSVYLLLLLSTILAVSIVQAQPKGKKNNSQTTPQQKTDSDAFGTDPKKTLSEGKLIEAGKYAMLGDYTKAISTYEDCIKLDPQNEAAQFEIAKIEVFQLNNFDDALTHIKAAYKIAPNNKWIVQLYAHVYELKNDFKNASKVLTKYLKENPTDLDALFNLSFFQQKALKFSDAIETYNKIELQVGVNPEIAFAKEKLWNQLGKPNNAILELQNLITKFPNEPKYYNALADLYFVNKMNDKGLDVLQQMVAISPDNPEAQITLAEYYRSIGDGEKYFASLKNAFQSSDLSIDIKMQLMLKLGKGMGNNKVYDDRILELAEIIAQVNSDEAKSFAMLGDVNYQLRHDSAAAQNYRAALKLDAGKFAIWQQLMLIETSLMQFDSLLLTSKSAMELYPDQPMTFYYNGVANLQKKNYPEAVSSFANSLKIGLQNKNLIAQIYANMGDAFNSLKKYSASDSCFDLALSFNADDANTLNNYAYYLALRGERLGEAEKMSKKSNDLFPNNANNLDTYAWVLFKEGKFDEAKSAIENALQYGGDKNGGILEHYGDILFKLGDTNGALDNWKKAKQLGVDSTNIDKKIADKKFYD